MHIKLHQNISSQVFFSKIFRIWKKWWRSCKIWFLTSSPEMENHIDILVPSFIHEKRSFSYLWHIKNATSPICYFRGTSNGSLTEELNGSFKRSPIRSLIYLSGRALPALIFLLPQLRFLCDVLRKYSM